MAKKPDLKPISHRRAGAAAHIAADRIVKSAGLKGIRLPSCPDSDRTEDRPNGFPFTRN